MKEINVDILVPFLSGQGGMETVAHKVADHYSKNVSSVRVRLIVPQGTKQKKWLKGINNEIVMYNNFSGPKILRQISGILFLFYYFIFNTSDTTIIVGMSTKLIKLADIFKKIFRKKIKIVSWVHFSINHEKAVDINELKRANYHLAISSGIKKQLIRNDISASKIKLIYNPVTETNDMIPRSRDNVLQLLYMGRVMLDGQKNLRELFYGLEKISIPWNLTIIGDGIHQDDVKKLAESLKISKNIKFCGWRENPWHFLEKIDFLILTSKYEGLPMVLIEAIEKGIPCISSNCQTGPVDIINNGNGYLYNPGNINDLKDKILLANKNKQLFKPEVVKSTAEVFLEKNYFRELTLFFETI